jgi:GntR family transcriptional regulator, transcriptional repressor for pyruvate dehydrogenase complex
VATRRTTTPLTNGEGLVTVPRSALFGTRAARTAGNARKGSSLSLTSGRERVTLPALIAGELRAQIETGILQPGDQLPGHRDIAASHEVSLGSAREAISLLIGDGLVETRHGRGTFVAEQRDLPVRPAAPVTREEVEELIEARELIGLQIVAMAAERASADHIRRLREVVARMQELVSDADRYPDADVEFYLLVAEAAHNRFLRQSMHELSQLIRQDIELAATAGIRRFGSLQYSVDAHLELVDAIEEGDPGEAQRVLLEILSRHHEFVIALYAIGTASPRETGE